LTATALAAGLIDVGRESALLTLKVVPYLVLGAVAGALLQARFARRWSARLFAGTGVRPLLAAIGAAALLPGCSCATMPMAAGLNQGDAPPRLGTTTAFIFMSPLLSPITVALTWAMLGWQLTFARVAASLAGSLLLGLIVNAGEAWLRGGAPATAVADVGSCTTAGCGPGSTCAPAKPGVWPSLWSILRSVTPYFLLGMLVAGALAAWLPEDSIPRFLGGASGVGAYLLAAVVGIPLYVCEGEEVPITFALLTGGLGAGPALTFLLGSVGTCVPTILMARGILGRRTTAVYTVFWILFAIAAGVAFQGVAGALE